MRCVLLFISSLELKVINGFKLDINFLLSGQEHESSPLYNIMGEEKGMRERRNERKEGLAKEAWGKEEGEQ